MKIQNTIFLLFLISISGFAQESSMDELKSKKDSLIELKTYLILDYHLSLGGKFVPNIDKECTEFKPRYLFWISNDKFYKQKFSECKKYPQIEIKHSELLSTILKKINQIRAAELLPVKSEEILQLLIDHDDIWFFKIYTNEDSFIKQIRRFELETEFINSNERNINYESNQKSILKKLIILVEKESY